METNEEEEKEEEEDETSVNLVASMGVILNCGGGYMGDIHMYRSIEFSSGLHQTVWR